MPSFKTSGTTGEPKSVALSDHEMAWRRDRTDHVKGSAFAAATKVFMYKNPESASAVNYQAWATHRGKTLVFPAKTDAESLELLAGCDAAIMAAPSAAKFAALWGNRPKLKVILVGGPMDRQVGKQLLATMAEKIWCTYSMTELNTIASGDFAAVADIPCGVGKVCHDMAVEIRAGEIWAGKSGGELIATGDLGELRSDGILCVTGRKPVQRKQARPGTSSAS